MTTSPVLATASVLADEVPAQIAYAAKQYCGNLPPSDTSLWLSIDIAELNGRRCSELTGTWLCDAVARPIEKNGLVIRLLANHLGTLTGVALIQQLA